MRRELIGISKDSRVNAIYEEIKSKHKLIKGIDFNNDIEVDKSDRFIIDREIGSLNFLYEGVRVIKPEEYSLVLGQMLIKNGAVEIISTLNNMTDNKVKRAHIIANKSFTLNEADSIQLDMELSKDDNFFIMINNKYSYDLYLKQMGGEIFLGGSDYDSPERKLVLFQFTTYLTTREYEGTTEKNFFSIPIDYWNKRNRMSFNMKKGFVLLEGSKLRTLPVSFADDEELYVSLVLNSHIMTEHNPSISVRKLELSKDSGFIYYKPVKLEASKARIFMLYSGTPIMQIYSQSKCRWSDITNNEQISDVNYVSLRTAMKNGDRIYRIFISEEN